MNCPHGLESVNCPECAIVELGVRLHDAQKRTAALEAELAQAKTQITALQEYNNAEVERRRKAEREAFDAREAVKGMAGVYAQLSAKAESYREKIEHFQAQAKPDYEPAVREIGRLARELGYTQAALKFATEGLEAVKKHQEFCCSGVGQSMSTTWNIAANALAKVECVKDEAGRAQEKPLLPEELSAALKAAIPPRTPEASTTNTSGHAEGVNPRTPHAPDCAVNHPMSGKPWYMACTCGAERPKPSKRQPEPEDCPDCDGAGQQINMAPGPQIGQMRECPACKGTGRVTPSDSCIKTTCMECLGVGVKTEEVSSVTPDNLG